MKKSNNKSETVIKHTTEEVYKKMRRGARLLVSLGGDGKGFLQSVAKRKQDPLPSAVVKELIANSKIGRKTKSKEFQIWGVK